MTHSLPIRIYWEDTDAAGIVYYANYLKFAERGRTEALRAAGFEQQKLRQQFGIVFVVRRCEIDYLRPARLDDALTVESCLQPPNKARMTMVQRILRGDTLLAELTVTLVCVNEDGVPTRVPDQVKNALETIE